MSDLHVKINLGIGDIIVAKTYLDAKKEEYNKIYIHKNRDIEYWRSKNNINFADEFLNLLFNESPYIIDDSDYPVESTGAFSYFSDKLFKKKDLTKYLCNSSYVKEYDNYIVLLTKIRGFDINKFNSIKSQIFSNINKLPFKIVLQGEKRLYHSNEIAVHKNNIFCIYDDIIKSIDSNKIIDLTIDDDLHNSPKLDNILRDCNIIHNSNFTVTFGISGAFIMAMSISKVLNFYDDSPIYGGQIFKMNENTYDDLLLCSNLHDFEKNLKLYENIDNTRVW